MSTTDEAVRAFGRTSPRPAAELWAEAEDAIEVVSRLWDSWEDDAVIRDRDTGRYVDRDRLHYIEFEGPFFSVRGPSITPRSPQGQPMVIVTAADDHATAVAARRADIVLVDVADVDTARRRRDDIRGRVAAAGRDPDDVTVLAVARVGEPGLRAELDRLLAASPVALDVVDDAAGVAATLESWSRQGAVDGFVVQPDVLPTSLDWLAAEVMPRLESRRPSGTLRERFGLPRPPNRYATTEVAL